MGFIFGNMPRKYTNYSKQSKNPRRPFEKEKLINDLTTIGIYGLRCKREVWSQQLVLAKLRKAARVLLCMDETDPRRIFEGEALIKRMVRLGLLDKYQRKLDYVLGLTVHQFMERRLQTLVVKKTSPNPSTCPESSSDRDTSPSASSSSLSLLSSSEEPPSNSSLFPPPLAREPANSEE